MTVVIMLAAALVLLTVGAVFGAWLIDGYWRERAWLEAREAQLTALWQAMQAANRIDGAFWTAREAMRRDAERQGEGK